MIFLDGDGQIHNDEDGGDIADGCDQNADAEDNADDNDDEDEIDKCRKRGSWFRVFYGLRCLGFTV